jgi:DNA (cytosine-5)-methyltransferase 1
MIQGFPKEFVEKARAAGVSDGALYKQAGNAVSVNIIYAIMLYLIENKIITE